MTDETLTVVSSYGARGSSTRVRLYEWLDHLRLDARREAYLGLGDNAPATLLPRLPAVVQAERRLREASRRGVGRLVLGREASPFSNGRIESDLLAGAAVGIYDVDDALYAYPSTGLRRVWSKRRVWAAAVSAADRVIAGNETLAEVAAAHARDVVIVPSCVEPDAYVRARHAERPGFRAVWVGSPTTERYLVGLTRPLLELARRTDFRLVVVSGGAAPLGPLDDIVERVPWTPSAAVEAMADADVGIMPLPDDEFSRGKCAYKLLQYAAAGLPVVASPVGANREALVRLGGDAAESDGDWIGSLEALAEAGPARRRARGEHAHSGVVDHYSFRAWADRWRAAVFG